MKLINLTGLNRKKEIKAGGAAVRRGRGLRLSDIVPAVLVCGGLTLVLCAGGCAVKRRQPVLETYYEEDSGADRAAAEVDEPSKNGEKDRESVPADTGPGCGDSAESGQAQTSLVTVHVCGAVCREGVYSLPAGTRLCDAIEAAGGFSEEADTACLNLAALIEDGSQIRVPTKEESAAWPETGYGANTGAASAEGGRININSAGMEELMQIPGIGETKARRILEYREQNGRFESIEDLMKVPGIKDASFQKLKDYITI